MSATATNATLASEVAPTAHTESDGVLVLGLDAGFKHFGWGVVRLLPEGGERVEALGSQPLAQSRDSVHVLGSARVTHNGSHSSDMSDR